MGGGVGDLGWRACRGPRAGVLKDLGFDGRGRGCVKTQAFNLRVESPSRFRQSKEE